MKKILTSSKILGIDIGGSGIKGAIVNIENGELETDVFRLVTPEISTPENIANTVNEIIKHFNWSSKIGIGFPAVVRNGIVFTATNIDKKWIGVNAENLFSEKSGCKVKVINDADAAGIAEMHFGAGREQNGVVILLTIGTGIGSAIFTNNILLPNTEFGHLRMKGKIAEKYASDFIRKKEDLSWKKWAKRFNKYLKRLEFLFWPDLFILGGGISKKADKYLNYFTINTEIKIAQLQNKAGIIGAALAANNYL